MNTENTWLIHHIQFIKALKNPTEQQRLLVLLFEKNPKTAQDDKKINALVKAEKAQERADKAKSAARKIISHEKIQERKARTKKLIEWGVLIEIAGLSEKNPAEILGFLLAGSQVQDEQKWENWKKTGLTRLSNSKNAQDQPDSTKK